MLSILDTLYQMTWPLSVSTTRAKPPWSAEMSTQLDWRLSLSLIITEVDVNAFFIQTG